MSVLVISMLLFCFCFVAADTIEVPQDYPTIQAAINASSSGDTVLVWPGTYEEQISFLGKNIVVRSANGPNTTRIYSVWMNPTAVFFVNGEDSTAVLEGFTVNNTGNDHSMGKDEPLPLYGGGIYIENSSPTIFGNNIEYCVADEAGGGIYSHDASPILIGNTIESCLANKGGGIYIIGSDETHNLKLIGNNILSNTSWEGGGGVLISYPSDWVYILGNVITENQCVFSSGGGIAIGGVDSILFAGNLICDNYAEQFGGGASIDGVYVLSIGNVISDNLAGYIGGCRLVATYACFHNNTVCSNSSENTGLATGGMGVFCDSVSMMNSIVWGNESPFGLVNNLLVFESVVDIDFSIIEGGLDSIWSDSLSVINWGEGNIDVDPLFETGPLSDYHLSEGSPCIDAGNPAPEYYDPEDPFNPGYALWPAMGYLRNDMGAYGGGGVGYWLGVEETEPTPPEPVPVLRSYPNPFNSITTLVFELPDPGRAEVRVYDLSGSLVDVLYDGETVRGPMTCYFDGSDLPSGVYIINLITEYHSVSVRSVLIR